MEIVVCPKKGAFIINRAFAFALSVSEKLYALIIIPNIIYILLIHHPT